jgi:hypothetical protein
MVKKGWEKQQVYMEVSERQKADSTGQSYSWDANSRLASQETFRILWSPKVHVLATRETCPFKGPNKASAQLSVLLLNIPFNIIHASSPQSS